MLHSMNCFSSISHLVSTGGETLVCIETPYRMYDVALCRFFLDRVSIYELPRKGILRPPPPSLVCEDGADHEHTQRGLERHGDFIDVADRPCITDYCVLERWSSQFPALLQEELVDIADLQ